VALPFAWYVYFAEKAGVAACRAKKVPLMVVSRSTRSEMMAKGFPAEEMVIVQNCVDHQLHRPDPGARSARPLIGYFGRLKKYKSVDHLLRAFAIVKESSPDLTLIVIGDGDHRPALEALAVDLGIGGAVRFTGYVDEKTKVRLLQENWFMVNTSSKEGWGLTVIEANACGTPVLASDVPGLRDAIKENETGLLYDYGNIHDLAGKMKLLLDDSAMRNRLSQGAIQWAQTFDWQIVAEQTVELLQRRIRG
jgi:glycosyltransferase involved in cell wall biosynthesis